MRLLPKTIVFFIIGVIVGFILCHVMLYEKITELELRVKQYYDLKEKYEDLAKKYNKTIIKLINLRAQYEAAKNRSEFFMNNIDRLLRNYFETIKYYNKIIGEYELKYKVLNNTMNRIINAYMNWYKWAYSYIVLCEYTGKRVFNITEIQKLEPIVLNVIMKVGNVNKPLGILEALFNYTIMNVKYSKDPQTPVPLNTTLLVKGITSRVSSQEVIQSPLETLSRGEGDCEDMAILYAGLLLAYKSLVPDVDYDILLVYLTLEKQETRKAHMIVLIKIDKCKVIIADPTGPYFKVVGKVENLKEYFSLWLKGGYNISKIMLFRVNVNRLIKLIEGDVETIINYMRS